MFEDRYEADPNSGCWLFTGCLHHGYGRVKIGGRKGRLFYVHRLMWEAENGPIPVGMDMLHRCDTPACVNPDHLFPGTAKDNAQDMLRKGRGRFPGMNKESRLKQAKLTEDQVRAIRVDKRLHRVIAADYGVSRVAIGKIINRKTWRLTP